jgi:exosortase E/protease (VPEID-CTERM system)
VSQASESRTSLGAAQLRGAALLALVLVEYLVLGTFFDGTDLAQRGGWGAHLSSLGESVTAVTVVLTAGVLLNRRALSEGFQECARSLSAVSRGWIGAHFALLALSVTCLFGVFRVDVTSTRATVLLALAWLATGVAAMVALVRAVFGRGAWILARALAHVALAGLALGYVAWTIALESRPLWPWFAHKTLLLSGALLELVTTGVIVDTENFELGAGGFRAHIAAECSGIEGVGLVTVFLLGYLFQFRRSLRFPRSLVLLPLAALVAWLANSLRLALLVLIGARVSPEVAFGGFHSKAGWILFCGIALSLVLVTHRTHFFAREAPPPAEEMENPTAAYLLPLLSVVAIGLFSALFSAGVDLRYPLRVVAAVSVLWLYRRYYTNIELRPGWHAVPIGILVFVIWVLLLPASDPRHAAELRDGVAGLHPDARLSWIGFRLVGGVLLTPIIEELAFRGFLQRRLISADFTEVSLKQLSLLSVGVSALAFGAVHQAWLAGTVAGLAFSFAGYRRGRLVDAIVAHATANGLIAVAVLGFGRWDLWL